MKKRSILFLNAIIVLFVLTGLLMMMLSMGDTLASSGLSALKYFTVQSNLFAGIASAAVIITVLRNKEIPHWLELVLLMATTAVALTFSAVMAFLGPLYGYWNMLKGPNLFFHLLVPLAAIVNFIFFIKAPGIKPAHVFLALVPSMLYSAFYLSNILINGVGEWPNRNDWYSFLHWGPKIGLLIGVIMELATLGIAALLRILNRAVNKKRQG